MAEELKKHCPVMGNGMRCIGNNCMWWTVWNDEGMCCANRIVQFINKKDVSNAEMERMRSRMEKEWHG